MNPDLRNLLVRRFRLQEERKLMEVPVRHSAFTPFYTTPTPRAVLLTRLSTTTPNDGA